MVNGLSNNLDKDQARDDEGNGMLTRVHSAIAPGGRMALPAAALIPGTLLLLISP